MISAPANAGSTDVTVTRSAPEPVVTVSEPVGFANVNELLPLVNDSFEKLAVIVPAAPALSSTSRSKIEPVNTRFVPTAFSGL